MAVEWEKHPFTADFLLKLVRTKDLLTEELVNGQLDKWGKDHSDSKRAVIHYANTLLSYLPQIKLAAEQVRKAQEQVEQRANRYRGDIHGIDRIVAS
jgi:cyclopropane fatty-acyl-phospholipid synthase-like methyltransferase